MVKISSCVQCPKPRKGDQVEMVNMTKMFGRIIGFKVNTKAKVDWENGDISTESIEELALVQR